MLKSAHLTSPFIILELENMSIDVSVLHWVIRSTNFDKESVGREPYFSNLVKYDRLAQFLSQVHPHVPTEPFAILEPQIPSVTTSYVLRKHRSTNFWGSRICDRVGQVICAAISSYATALIPSPSLPCSLVRFFFAGISILGRFFAQSKSPGFSLSRSLSFLSTPTDWVEGYRSVQLIP